MSDITRTVFFCKRAIKNQERARRSRAGISDLGLSGDHTPEVDQLAPLGVGGYSAYIEARFLETVNGSYGVPGVSTIPIWADWAGA